MRLRRRQARGCESGRAVRPRYLPERSAAGANPTDLHLGHRQIGIGRIRLNEVYAGSQIEVGVEGVREIVRIDDRGNDDADVGADSRDLQWTTRERGLDHGLERGQLIGLVEIGGIEEAIVAAQAKRRRRAGQTPDDARMHMRREMRREFRNDGSHSGQRLRNIDMAFSRREPHVAAFHLHLVEARVE